MHIKSTNHGPQSRPNRRARSLKGGQSVFEVVSCFGIKKRTVYNWLARYRAAGVTE
ncbi:helix-turn-helix domain-containing protein [Pontibacterium sp.]|uniref:helix-turn-helix domain-containing protein n=1 Tax=Pontibacterium sp. TaxID=2036026 RepID=UPI00356278D1